MALGTGHVILVRDGRVGLLYACTARDAGWWQLLESMYDATATAADYRTVEDLLDADDDFRFYTAYASDEAALQEQHRKSLHGGPHLFLRPTQPASVSDDQRSGRRRPCSTLVTRAKAPQAWLAFLSNV